MDLERKRRKGGSEDGERKRRKVEVGPSEGTSIRPLYLDPTEGILRVNTDPVVLGNLELFGFGSLQ